MPLKIKLYSFISALVIVIIYGACANLKNSLTEHYKKPYYPSEYSLALIQKKYPEVSIQNLNNGYKIYFNEACIKCHTAYYSFQSKTENSWRTTLDTMAIRAKLSDIEKKDILMYVLSIKAKYKSQ